MTSVILTDHVATWMAAAAVVATASQFALALEPPKNFVTHDAPRPVAAVAFEDGRGQPRSLADFKGKVVLLNIWATWCASCRQEMPALDRLQAALGGPDFEVVPVSIDRGGFEAARKFYAEIGLRDVAIYVDASGQVVRALGAVGLPTTLLIDRGGREIGRITGPAEWDAPEIVAFLRSIVGERGDAAERLARNGEGTAAQKHEGATPLQLWFRWLKALFLK